MLKIVILSTFTTLLITSGQVLWKLGLNRIGGFYLGEYGLLALHASGASGESFAGAS
jgi:hypothetical protein